ncbi:probable plastidic glucose transporter 3 [Tanacetum coccineum]|uniref:Probable plastidic glucose transporter 3 n=1 Tax=Tanacetum coccineum TaxID=301880 RepID=A0ABQ5G1F1_9ASTR
MHYDFEMECKTMVVSKKPNLEIGNTFCHPSSTDVGRCGSGFPLNMHIVGEDIVISSCMTNNARAEATKLLSDSCSQVQLNKTKSEVTFSGKQNPFAKGKNLMNTQVTHCDTFVAPSNVFWEKNHATSCQQPTNHPNVQQAKSPSQSRYSTQKKSRKLQQGQRSLLDSVVHTDSIATILLIRNIESKRLLSKDTSSTLCLCIDMAINILFFHVQDGDDRHGAVFIGSALLALQQFFGINVVFYFSSTVFKSARSSPDIANMLANLSGSLVAMSLLDIEGERMPMYMRSINIDMYVTSEFLSPTQVLKE